MPIIFMYHKLNIDEYFMLEFLLLSLNLCEYVICVSTYNVLSYKAHPRHITMKTH